jgi:integrase/recombinase XerD
MFSAGAEASSVCRRLSGVSSFYRYCAGHDLVAGNPTTGVERPEVDPDHTSTVGLDRDQACAMVAAADADRGAHRLRTALAIRLLLHNALRVDEVCAADLADLGSDRGHRVLGIVGKGNHKAKVPLTPGTLAALEAYLAERAARAGVLVDALTGPLLATRTGGRMNQGHLWELVRRLARAGGSRPGRSCRRIRCGTALSRSRWTPALRCAMCRTTPATATRAPPGATTGPGPAWIGRRPTRWPPTWLERARPH